MMFNENNLCTLNNFSYAIFARLFLLLKTLVGFHILILENIILLILNILLGMVSI